MEERPPHASTHRALSMTTSSRLSRRGFLKQSVAAAAAGVAVADCVPRHVLATPGRPGANDRVIIGFVGTGGRARQLMDHVPAGGRIVAISDCYRQRWIDTLKEKKKDWKTYRSHREMLDKEKLDAVFVTTTTDVCGFLFFLGSGAYLLSRFP